MKFKTRIIIVIFITSIFVSFTPLFCNQQGSGGGNENEKPTVEVLTTKHPFYDAKELDGALKERKWAVIKKILSKYVDKKITSPEDAADKFGKNDFLKPYITAWGDSSSEQGPETDVIIKEKEVLPSTAKGFPLSPEVVVDALATLIAERFKEELSIAYLKKFEDKLEKSGLNKLFPSTAKFLTSAELFNFKLFMPALKAALQEDLHKIHFNLKDFLIDRETRNDQVEKIENKDAMYLAILFLDLVIDVQEGKHLADIIEDPFKLNYLDKMGPEFSNPMRLLALLSRNLRARDGKGWIKPPDFGIFIKEESTILRELFVGLIYEKEIKELKKIEFKVKKTDNSGNITIETKNLGQIIYGKKDKIKEMNGHLHSIILLADKIQNHIKKLEKEEEDGKVGYEKYHFYLNSVIDFVELGADTAKLIGGIVIDEEADKDILKNFEKVIHYGRVLVKISENIHNKLYGAAFANSLDLLKDIWKKDSPIRRLVFKYMTFAINMATAENAKEMQKVLEAAALPVGSYRIKRANYLNIALNAYPGVFGGGDILTTGEELDGSKGGVNVGLAAPIGLAFSLGNKLKDYDNPGTSTTVFISIIDIGAAVNWRLGGADKGMPEFSWKNVFAPGLFLIGGIKKTPVSIGIGVQYGPQLRKIEMIEGDPQAVIESASFRFGFLVAVDIPLFNIYTKEEEKNTGEKK